MKEKKLGCGAPGTFVLEEEKWSIGGAWDFAKGRGGGGKARKKKRE